MDASAQPTATPVLVGPGLSVAAQVATDRNPLNPVAAVNKQLLTDVGVKTHGWVHAGDTWWKEHSTQVWGIVVGIDATVAIIQPIIPPGWTRVAATVSAIGGVAGIILKYRVQVGIALDRIRGEVRRNTP